MIRASCLLARQTIDLAHSMAKPGVTTDEIDVAVHDFIIANGAYPSPFNYYKFPKSVCTSVNEVICHGIPDSRPLKNGDILNCDVTVYLNGYHGDLNETYLIGTVDAETRRLVETAYACIMAAIDTVKPGLEYKKLGNTITKVAESAGFTVNRTYCGHGVGRMFHCAPTVPHYAKNNAPGKMRPGHVFTIEPMINAGHQQDQTWPDNWTAVSIDGKRSA
jgi:methionyl aminopeptidase